MPVALDAREVANEDRREAYVEAGLAALELGDEAVVERLVAFVAELPPVFRTPVLRAVAARFDGLLAARRSDVARADERLAFAARTLRDVDARFLLAQVLLERAELLHGNGRDQDAASPLAEATDIFTRLRATPYVERAQELGIRVVT